MVVDVFEPSACSFVLCSSCAKPSCNWNSSVERVMQCIPKQNIAKTSNTMMACKMYGMSIVDAICFFEVGLFMVCDILIGFCLVLWLGVIRSPNQASSNDTTGATGWSWQHANDRRCIRVMPNCCIPFKCVFVPYPIFFNRPYRSSKHG